jgi:peroxiredoxin
MERSIEMRRITALTCIVALGLIVSLANAEDKKAKAKGGVEIGQDAPALALKNHKGETTSLADYRDKNIVVLEWFNEGCPVTQRHLKENTMKELADKFRDKGVTWLAVSSTGSDAQANAKTVEKGSLNYTILADTDTAAAKAFGAKATPHMFIIDKSGKVAYAGAIDNDPDGSKKPEQRINYVEKALNELLAGKAVSEPETKAYGCGVKVK